MGRALRAMGDVRSPMMINIIATWRSVMIAWIGV
jgi:Na+-driven multidrug efflux pump